MAIKEIKSKLETLKSKLHRWNHAYYILDNPEVDDAVYDAAMRDLLELEKKYPELITPDSPSQRIGNEPVTNFKKVIHKTPLYSLDNAVSFEELEEWQERISRILGDEPQIDYVCEMKIDGLAIALTYENGILISGTVKLPNATNCILDLFFA